MTIHSKMTRAMNQFAMTYVWWEILVKSVRLCYNLLVLLYRVKSFSLRFIGKSYSFIDDFERRVRESPNHVQFITVEDGRELTLAELDSLSNRIAHWMMSLHLKPRDAVCLMIGNSPTSVAFWLGVAKLGMSTALVNTNIPGNAVIHAVEAAAGKNESGRKILVIDTEVQHRLQNDGGFDSLNVIRDAGIEVFEWSCTFRDEVEHLPPTKPLTFNPQCKESDILLYIYTSGTTGLPKASKISHSRYKIASQPFGTVGQLGPHSRVYVCLPLYHSSACMLGVGSAMLYGATVVLRKKFSARSFAADCVKYRCNAMQYIGELCRYLVHSPVSAHEKNLRLQCAFGNGLRPEVWEAFKTRFRVDNIVEFYASTEGNLMLFNSTGLVGALGFIPRIADVVYPVKMLRVDPDNNEKPLRDAAGRCLLCPPHEVGLIVSAIDGRYVDKRFDGYGDAAATEKKVLRDVFREGDTYFNTGDLMYRDRLGFFYWADRTGDTFRWKGENVSTCEVAAVIMGPSEKNASIVGTALTDAVVYGVAVPGQDGRAGMAALRLSKADSSLTPRDTDADSADVDVTKPLVESMLAELDNRMTAGLPAYARPRFFRITNRIVVTTTYKYQKGDLIKEGFDPAAVAGDLLYFYDVKARQFHRCDSELHQKIIAGAVLL